MKGFKLSIHSNIDKERKSRNHGCENIETFFRKSDRTTQDRFQIVLEQLVSFLQLINMQLIRVCKLPHIERSIQLQGFTTSTI